MRRESLVSAQARSGIAQGVPCRNRGFGYVSYVEYSERFRKRKLTSEGVISLRCQASHRYSSDMTVRFFFAEANCEDRRK